MVPIKKSYLNLLQETYMSSFIAMDFETADYYRNSACALGIVKVVDLKIVDRVSWLIRPPGRNFRFTHIHGLTWEDVKDEPDFGDIWPEVKPFFDGADFAAAHNIGFDRSVLKACCEEYGIDMPDMDYRCTLKLSRNNLNLCSNTLDTVCDHLGFELDHHEVLSDTVACANIMIHFMKNHVI